MDRLLSIDYICVCQPLNCRTYKDSATISMKNLCVALLVCTASITSFMVVVLYWETSDHCVSYHAVCKPFATDGDLSYLYSR